MTATTCPQCQAANRENSRFCAECGAPLPVSRPAAEQRNTPDQPASAGLLLERYRIEVELGRGGFGAVYKAWDTHLERPVAVKENLLLTPESGRQFAREAQVLSNLSHPNLPRVIDHFTIPERGQYLVMDFVEGGDLASLLDRGSGLPVEQALDWIIQVCEALEYLHGQDPPLVHRDIKPANIRVTPRGRAMLVDFGLVKAYNPEMRTTLGARAVSPGYAPPEQYGLGATDARSDIYALAATLYSLLTGQLPVESVQRLSGRPLPAVEQANPQVEARLGQAVVRGMALDPEQRYQSAAEFRTALLACSQPAGAPTPVVQTVVAGGAPPVVQVVGGGQAAALQVPEAQPGILPGKALPGKSVQAAAVQPVRAGRRGLLPLVLAGLAALVCLGVAGGAFGLFRVLQQPTVPGVDRQATVAAQVRATSSAMAPASLVGNATRTAEHLRQEQTEQARATATMAALQVRGTLNASATARAARTLAARVGATSTKDARATATRQAGSTATADRVAALISSLFAPTDPIFESVSENLNHDTHSGKLVVAKTGQNLANFIVEARFFNPYAASTQKWDCGFIFRSTGSNQHYRLVIMSTQAWHLTNHTGKADGRVINYGSLPGLKTGLGESNLLRLVVYQEMGWFYLNGELIALLDLSDRTDAGDIMAATQLFTGSAREGAVTHVEAFKVWELPK